MSDLNKLKKDTLWLYTIRKEQYIKHYNGFWNGAVISHYEANSVLSMVSLIYMKRTTYHWTTHTHHSQADEKEKATKVDGISVELLKYGWLCLELHFLFLTNTCWKHSVIPEKWKIAESIPLFKRKDWNHCRNYYGINLLNMLHKFYARIVNNQLKHIIMHYLERSRMVLEREDPVATTLQYLGKSWKNGGNLTVRPIQVLQIIKMHLIEFLYTKSLIIYTWRWW